MKPSTTIASVWSATVCSSVRLRGAHDQARSFGSWKITLPRFVVDGEDGVLGIRGISNFNALPYRTIMKRRHRRTAPLEQREPRFDRLLAPGPEGVFVNWC